MTHALLIITGWTLFIGGAIALVARVTRRTDKPRSTPPDPRTPAVNLVWPDDVDHLLDDTAGDLLDDVERTEPRALACGYCGVVSTGAGTLEAIVADQAHFRTVHALRLAAEVAS